MGGKQTLALWDYDKEVSTVSIPVIEIDEVNLVAQDALMDAFLVAIDAVSLGVVYKDTRVFKADQIAGTPPGSRSAQREKKWLVQMTGATSFRAYTMEIPEADLLLLDDQAKGKMDVDDAAYIALKAAIEAMYYGDAGESVVVGDIIFVGRNL
jgi:hypothetical protein